MAVMQIKMKILLIDDHALLRECLCHVLTGLDKEMEILQASDFAQVVQSLMRNIQTPVSLLRSVGILRL